MAEHERTYYKDGPHMLCLPSGPAFIAGGGGMRRIVQSPTMIAVLNSDLTYRQIFMDGRALEPDPLPIFMGYSVGRWDGDTLVVESNGFNDKTWLHRKGWRTRTSCASRSATVASDFGHMQLDVTYDDPGTFDSPLHASVKLEYAADDVILELVCNEASEGGVKHWVGDKASDNRVHRSRGPSELSPNTSARIKGYWLDNLITAEFTLEDGGLFMRRNGVKIPLLAQSETTFVARAASGVSRTFSAREGDGTATAGLRDSGFGRVDLQAREVTTGKAKPPQSAARGYGPRNRATGPSTPFGNCSLAS